MTGSPLVVAVTGSNGYLGGVLSRTLEERGARLHRLSRAPTSGGFPSYRLETPPDSREFSSRGVTALVHCAYDFTVRDPEAARALNVNGTLRLFDAARQGGVERLVLVSSLSAFDGCVTIYGQSKRTAEKAVLAMGGLAVRPGLIYGNETGGLVGDIARQVRTKAFIPVMTHPGKLYTTYARDLCEFLYDLCAADAAPPRRPYFCAAPTGWKLNGIVRAIATAARRDVRVIPVPWRLVWSGLKLAETAGVRLQFRSDSVLGLGHLVPPGELARLETPAAPFREFDPALI